MLPKNKKQNNKINNQITKTKIYNKSIGNSARTYKRRCCRKTVCNFCFLSSVERNNPSLSIYNKSLKEDILIRFVSITETCTHASRLPESTLAVLHMDAILENARKVAVVKPKNNGNQKPFEKIIVLEYLNNTLGRVRVTVGVKRRTHEKVLYSITSEKE